MQFIDTCDFIISVVTQMFIIYSIGQQFFIIAKDIGRLWYWENVIDGEYLVSVIEN